MNKLISGVDKVLAFLPETVGARPGWAQTHDIPFVCQIQVQISEPLSHAVWHMVLFLKDLDGNGCTVQKIGSVEIMTRD